MAKRKFKLKEKELAELRQRMDASRKADTRTRYQGVWLYGKGYPVGEILEITGCCRTSVMKWCRSYQEKGVDSLEDKRIGGNSAKLTTDQLAEIKDRMHSYTPQQLYGAEDAASLTGEFWTIEDLYRMIEDNYGVTYQSRSSYQNIFAKSGFSYQRTEKIYKSRRPKKVAEFQEQLEKN